MKQKPPFNWKKLFKIELKLVSAIIEGLIFGTVIYYLMTLFKGLPFSGPKFTLDGFLTIVAIIGLCQIGVFALYDFREEKEAKHKNKSAQK